MRGGEIADWNSKAGRRTGRRRRSAISSHDRSTGNPTPARSWYRYRSGGDRVDPLSPRGASMGSAARARMFCQFNRRGIEAGGLGRARRKRRPDGSPVGEGQALPRVFGVVMPVCP